MNDNYYNKEVHIMARPKKDGKPVSLIMERTLFEELESYCEEMGQTKTTAIERILRKHFEERKAAKER